jgi:putative tryptophan/tyrosine transport system substrate-binding protein
MRSPAATRGAIVHAPENPNRARYLNAIEAANARLKMQLVQLDAHDGALISRAIDAFADGPNGALLVLPGASTSAHRGAIVAAANRGRLPAIYPFRHYAVEGGLASYGADQLDLFRRAASYVDRILRGEKACDLPVQQPTKFELIINLRTAKMLGITIPLALHAAADEVIE